MKINNHRRGYFSFWWS